MIKPWARRCRVWTAGALTGLMCAALPTSNGRAESGNLIRLLPYPFTQVASFASDVDMQKAWHGAAIHRVFNEDIGLPVSDSLWPQGSATASAFFEGFNVFNRSPSGVGSHPVFALLLREWHRGNIDHFHGWQEDGTVQIRNEIEPPLAISGERTSFDLPAIAGSFKFQTAQNFRFYFSAEPPSDLSVVLHEPGGKSIFLSAGQTTQGKNVQFEKGTQASIVEVIVPVATAVPSAVSVNLMNVDRVEFVAPSCTQGCPAKLLRVERDNFSRQTVLSQSRWLERWNVRPALLTSHGGNTLVQDYGVEGKFLDIPRTPGTAFADPTVATMREALADRKESHAYHSDILKRLSVAGVWSYFPKRDQDVVIPLVVKMPLNLQEPLSSTYAGLYNVPRTRVENLDLSNQEKFAESLKLSAPMLADDIRRSLYCGTGCNASQGDALALLLSQSIYLVDAGETIRHFWYTHFGSGGSDFRPTAEDPVTPNVLKWMRRFANYVYNFDGSVAEDRRIWSPPANTWVRYQIMQAGLSSHVRLSGNGSAVHIDPWQDPVTGATVPDPLAGTRDLNGLTIYVDDPSAASVKIADKEIDTFTRNPADATGRTSITIVDGNTPTTIIGRIALGDRGTVATQAGRFDDISASEEYIHLVADDAGRATLAFKPWALDLWNTTQLHIEMRKRINAATDAATVSGSLTVELELDDGGIVSIIEGEKLTNQLRTSSAWFIPNQTTIGGWQRHTLDVSRLVWPRMSFDEDHWRRPPLPLGHVKEVRLHLAGAKPGESVDIRHLMALRPSGNGEAPTGGKLVAGRITIDGTIPLPLVRVEAETESGEFLSTTTDRDGYYFFYDRPREQRLAIRARFGETTCNPLQGRKIEVQKNEAEIDIQTNLCSR